MSYNYPTVIVDDFFETPTLVREWALGLNYLPAAKHPSGGYWSGVRATPLPVSYTHLTLPTILLV